MNLCSVNFPNLINTGPSRARYFSALPILGFSESPSAVGKAVRFLACLNYPTSQPFLTKEPKRLRVPKEPILEELIWTQFFRTVGDNFKWLATEEQERYLLRIGRLKPYIEE